MVLFGLYMVPRKLCGLRDGQFVLTMCIGAVVTTQAAQLLAHRGHLPTVPAVGALLSFSCGPIWTLGMLSYTLSVSRMGLTLATPIKNTTAILGTLFGLFVFSEWRETDPVLAILGSLLVVACAVVLGACGDKCAPRGHVTVAGVAFALLAALFFSAYTIPLRLAQQQGVDSYRLMAYMGLGTLAGAVVVFGVFTRGRRDWLHQPMRDHAFAALAGCIWALATITMSEAIARIGLAITWPVTNLNTVVTVAAGIYLFREVDLRRHWRTVALAMLCAVAGTLLLGLARR
jgi:glucose uptake protein